jgi:hypothetical protein
MNKYLEFDSEKEAQDFLDGLNKEELHLSKYNSEPTVTRYHDHWRIMSRFEHDVVAMSLREYLCENGIWNF